MSQNSLPTPLDTSKKGVDIWKNLSQERRDLWREYLEIIPYNPKDLKENLYFGHPYSYHLTNDEISKTVFCLVLEIIRYNIQNRMNLAFFGNSGGLDSATICALLLRAQKLSLDLNLKFEVISYGLPIKSNPEHNTRAEETAQRFGIEHLTLDGLDSVYDNFEKTLLPLTKKLHFNDEELRRGFGNVKARIRMIVNFFGTTKPNSYVVSTDNLSELYMAFWTLMGDVGAFGPIQNVLKGLELPGIAYSLGVPEATLSAKPTDGLQVHQSLDSLEGGDTDAFKGVGYPHLDAIICYAVKNGLRLYKSKVVKVDASKIKSEFANQETVDYLIKQMVNPGSVWKRTKGSIGTSISREDLDLPSLTTIVSLL